MISETFFGTNEVARANAKIMISELLKKNDHPLLLIIGGGAIGSGSELLYDNKIIKTLSLDVYGSDNVDIISDAHQLPLSDESVDGVWIQAVLEHVLDPVVVASQIYRVLKPDGLVYADTPFLQNVHEGPYDFTRYTESGHRWLFKQFSRINSGITKGPGTVLLWSLTACVHSVFRNKFIARMFRILFFWIRFIDYACGSRQSLDSASGFFILGRKSETPMSCKDIIPYYKKSNY